jgi:prepilin-type N-terminal cleavage/methylation domain-containing protein
MSPVRSHDAFTLIELMVGLLVMALLAGALALPLAAQLQARRFEDTRRQLEAASDALLGYASAHGRLPCPALESSAGQEAFATGGDSLNGECATFHDGLLPAATLGLAGLDAQGFLRDPWETAQNRLRYAVAGTTVNGVTRPFTRNQGMRTATLGGLADAGHLLFVCSSGDAASASGCGPASAQLTRKAVFVVLSRGPNAAHGAPAGDEARNADGDASFVAHEPRQGPGPGFDDVVHWAGVPLLVHRLLAAGRLP